MEARPKWFSVSLSQPQRLLSSLTDHYQDPYNKKNPLIIAYFPNNFNNIFTE